MTTPAAVAPSHPAPQNQTPAQAKAPPSPAAPAALKRALAGLPGGGGFETQSAALVPGGALDAGRRPGPLGPAGSLAGPRAPGAGSGPIGGIAGPVGGTRMRPMVVGAGPGSASAPTAQAGPLPGLPNVAHQPAAHTARVIRRGGGTRTQHGGGANQPQTPASPAPGSSPQSPAPGSSTQSPAPGSSTQSPAPGSSTQSPAPNTNPAPAPNPNPNPSPAPTQGSKVEIDHGGFKKWEGKSGASKNFEVTGTLAMGQTGWGYDYDDLAARLDYMGQLSDDGRADEIDGKYGATEDLFAGELAEASTETYKRDGNNWSDVGASAGASIGAGVDADGYVANGDAWLAGGKMGVGGRFDATVGGKAGASAGASGGAGPAIGAIDPITGKRHDLVEGSASADASAFVGGRVSGAGEAYVEGTSVGAAGQVSAEIAARGSANASAGGKIDVGGFTLAGAQGSAGANAEARAGANASGEVKGSLTSGLAAQGSASAELMARANAHAGGEVDLLGVSAKGDVSGNAEAGAAAGARGGVAIGVGTIGATGAVEAFAGARASATVSDSLGFLGVDVFSSSLTGTVAAGAGGEAGGGIMIKDGILTINAELLVAEGVGGGISGSFSVDFFSPFKMILRMLETNGIIAANPDAWIADIIGCAMGGTDAYKERLAGRPDEEDGTTKTDQTKTIDGTKVKKTEHVNGQDMSAPKQLDPGALANAKKAATPPGGFVPPASAAKKTTDGDGKMVALGGASHAQTLGGMGGGASGMAAMSKAATAPAAPTFAPGGAGHGAGAQAKGDGAHEEKRHDTDGGAMDAGQAEAKLGSAHGLAMEAAIAAQSAIRQAMEMLKNGMANPAQIIKAILKGAGRAIGSMIQSGIAMAGGFVSSIAHLAHSAIASIGHIIEEIVKAIFTGHKPDFSGGYESGAAGVDAGFAGALQRTKADMDKLKETQAGSVRNAVQEALTTIATGFVSSSQQGVGPAKAKADKAQSLISEVAGKNVRHADGSTTKASAKATKDATDVSGLIGQMSGAAQSSASNVKAGASGFSKMADGAAAGMTAPAKNQLEGQAKKAYEGPKKGHDKDVAKSRNKAESKYEGAKGKHKKKR